MQTQQSTTPLIMELVRRRRNHLSLIQFNERWAHLDDGISLCASLYFYWNFPSHGIRWASYLWHQTSITRALIQMSPINARQIVKRIDSIGKLSQKLCKWHGIWCANDSSLPMHHKWSLCLGSWWEIWSLEPWLISKNIGGFGLISPSKVLLFTRDFLLTDSVVVVHWCLLSLSNWSQV